ncbi:MAG: hypothetical protein MPK08_03045 [Alphaproteobacteria bacterium]|nr:hypothetical protein [Alphaproteobacteria bacterium]
MAYYWKSRKKRLAGTRWKVEEHDTFEGLRDSMESQMGEGWDFKVMTLDQCINDEERHIRKSGMGAGSEVHLAVANLNILCDKVAERCNVYDARILEYDSEYTGHSSEIEALHYAACKHWPDLKHEIVEVLSEVVEGEPQAITLGKEESAQRGDCHE